MLKQDEIKLINSTDGNLLRHLVKDYEMAFNREELHYLLKIPKSLDWGAYECFIGKQNLH